MPRAILIAGVNGAGKTTFARQLMPLLYPGVPFLNADEIGREHGRFAHPVTAGKELLRRLAALERERRSFAIETTLSSARYAQRIPRWRAAGYRVVLHYLELPSADDAVARVARRVRQGGHDIPEADIRRRFERSRRMLESVYRPAADVTSTWESTEGGFRATGVYQRDRSADD